MYPHRDEETRVNEIAHLARKRTLRVAGLMSGTSADGVDVAIVDLSAGAVRVRAFETVAYPPAVRRAVLDACRGDRGGSAGLSRLNVLLGERFAEALLGAARRAGIDPRTIDLVGSHGQTVWHEPGGRRMCGRKVRSTLQIAEPSVIAERTGITTVADFRPRDVAAGGQGAPLVPHADRVLFAHRIRRRAVQNLGGIANVTYLPPTSAGDDPLAFDTGPGNMVIDALVAHVTGGRMKFDRGGRLASRGKACPAFLDELLRHPYFRRRPPKTTGREQFGAAYAERLIARARRRKLAGANLIATATALTARSIADAYRRFLPAPPDEVILCGGGARNDTLVELLRAALHPARVLLMDELGIDADAKEAVSFAILAAETIRGNRGNVPSATGARRAVVLGKIIPAGT